MQNLTAYTHLHSLGDLLLIDRFDNDQIMTEIAKWHSMWKRYNPRKLNNNRWGLSITSIDGGLSGIPDLDSLHQYNIENNTNIDNRDICKLTDVYFDSPEIQRILSPYLPWMTRCHLLKLNSGGFFPDHYDTNKTNHDFLETRLVGFVNNCNKYSLKFLLEDRLLDCRDGELYWFNASKRHSVFSFTENCIMMVVCLKFDAVLFDVLIDKYRIK